MRDLSKVIWPIKKFGFKNGQSKVYTNQSIGKATKLDFSWGIILGELGMQAHELLFETPVFNWL